MEERFDLVLQVDEVQKRLRKTIGKEQQNLLDWNEQLNHYMPEPYPEEKVFYAQSGEEKEGYYRDIIRQNGVKKHGGCQESKQNPPPDSAITSLRFSEDSQYSKHDRTLSALAVKYQEESSTDHKKDNGRDRKRQKTENVILSLTFQLNQLLMLINNPMMFPHRAYAGRFRQVLDCSQAPEHVSAGTDIKE